VSLHPLVLAIGLLDLIAWAIYLPAARRLLAALPHWRPESGDARQLWRERALELAAYQGRWVMGMQTAAFVLFLIGVSNLWPPCVPGAMCGAGVLNAMGTAGEQTLIFRGLTLLLFYCRHAAEQLERSDPLPVAPAHGRMLLLAAPLMALATWTFVQAVSAMSGPAPVSCCAALYDQAAAGRLNLEGSGISTRFWAAACFGGALLVAAWGWLQYRRPGSGGRKLALLSALLIPAWTVAAYMALKTVVAPYLFQILYHPCPWCFFLWDQHALGFVLFGLPAWMVAETAAALTVRAAGRHGRSAGPVRARLASTGLRIWAGSLLFAAAAAAPVLLWRLRSGGWIN